MFFSKRYLELIEIQLIFNAIFVMKKFLFLFKAKLEYFEKFILGNYQMKKKKRETFVGTYNVTRYYERLYI